MMAVVDRISADPRSLSGRACDDPKPRRCRRHPARHRHPDGDRNTFAAAATRCGLGEIPRRGAASQRAGLPVRIRISDGAFRSRAARKTVEGRTDPLRDRLRRRLCLHGAAQSGDGPSHRHNARPVRSRVRLRLLLRLRLCLLHVRSVARLCHWRDRTAGSRTASRPC